MLNLDNLVLLLYFIFVKLGISNVFFFDRENIHWVKWVGYNWENYFVIYKSGNQNFSFSNFILDRLLEDGIVWYLDSLKSLMAYVICWYISTQIPVFFLFGVMFFLSVVFS